MNLYRNVVRAASLVATLGLLSGCSSTSSSTVSGAGAAADMTATAKVVGSSLMDQLGGMAGVTKLVEAFGVNLAGNPAIAKFLDAAAITQTKNGLVNEIAKVSGVTPPNPGADLKATLSGKGIDAAGVDALSSSLASAADQAQLAAPAKTSLMALFTPIANSLLGK